MKIRLLLLSLILGAGTAVAQNTPRWELYGGYQYTRLDTATAQNELNTFTQQLGVPPVSLGSKINLQGWNASLQESTNSWFGGVVDFSGNYVTKDNLAAQFPGFTNTLRTRIRFYTFTAGPQLTLRRSSRLQPFARVLVGGAYEKVEFTELVNGAPAAPATRGTDVGFAMGGGGGVDFTVLPRVALRLGGDVLRSYLGGQTEDNFRASIGLAFRIASR